MNNTPNVSVIIPVYNVEKYLRECLDSIVNQTLRDIEIICIDDGSTDGSPSILREYSAKDERITVITQENKGLSGARNAGLDIARGKYIYFIDSDDILKKEVLAELVNFAECENTDILFFDSEVLYENEEAYANRGSNAEDYFIRSNDYSKVTDGPDLFTAMMSNNEYRCSACLYMTSAKHISELKLYFFEGIFYEDSLFTFVCLMQASRAAHINKPCYIRRVRMGSIMRSRHSFHNFYSALTVNVNLQAFLADKDYPGSTRNQIDRYLEELKNGIVAMYLNDRGNDEWLGRLNTHELHHAMHLLEIEPASGSIPKIIHYCWFGGSPKSEKIQQCMESWRKFLPDYEIIEWNESNCDINGSEYPKDAYEDRAWAFVADYFRFKVLYEHGGIYLDTDVLLHGSLDEFLQYNAFFPTECYEWVNAAIIGAIPRSVVIKKIFDQYNEKKYKRYEKGDGTICQMMTNVLIDDYGYQRTGFTQMLRDNVAVFSPNILVVNVDDGKNYCEHLYSASVSWRDDNKRELGNATWKFEVLQRYFYNMFGRPVPGANQQQIISMEHDTRALIDRYGAKRVIIRILKERLYPHCPRWVIWVYRKLRGR